MRKATLICILILLCISCRSSNPIIALNTQEIPEHSYIYTFGTKNNAEALSCKLQHFIHPESGVEVSVLGMIHMAHLIFDKAHHMALRYDLTLSEGVHGSSSLSAHHFLVKYIGSYFSRINFGSRLVPQNHFLLDSGKEINADMSLKDFGNQGSFYTPVLQVLTLPLMIIGGEVSNLALYLKYQLSGAGISHSLQINELIRNRKLLFGHMRDINEKNFQSFLVIIKRNKHLLGILDEEIAKKSKSFFIPWGAAHSPDIEKRLLARGFVKNAPPEWILSIDFNSINEAHTKQYYLPLIYYFYTDLNTFDYSLILGIFKGFVITMIHHSSIFWNLLYTSSKSSAQRSFTLLPKIFDRPVLFSYTSSYKKRKIRALFFFDFEWEK